MKSLPKAARARTRRRLIAACAIALPLVAAPLAQAATCPTSKLVTAWSASPTDALSAGFTNQTVRMMIRPHTSGDRLRVRLSNRFGTKTLNIAHATIAVQKRGQGITPSAALLPGSARDLKFSTLATTSIPKGEDGWSDEITLPPFDQNDRFAIDLALIDPTGPATKHYRGYRTSYVSKANAGDIAGTNVDLATNFPANRQTDEVFFVAGLEVRKPGNWGTVVAFGDSLTDGTGSKAGQVSLLLPNGEPDTDQRYPDWLQASLKTNGRNLVVANAGIAGNRLLFDANFSYQGDAGQKRYIKDVVSQAGVTDVVILLGGNDFAAGAFSASVIDGYERLIANLHAQVPSLNVIVTTLPPFSALADFLVHNRRLALNAWVRATAKPHVRTANDTAADGYFDMSKSIQDPALNPQGGLLNPDRMNPAYDSGDGVHPNALGYKRYVDDITAAGDLAKLKGPNCT